MKTQSNSKFFWIRKYFASVGLFVALLHMSPVLASSSCEIRESYLRSAIKNSIGVTETLNNLVKTKPQILMLGESHDVGAGKRGYFNILTRIKSMGFKTDCILVESDRSLQPFWQEVVSGRISWEEFVKKGCLDSGEYAQLVSFARAHGVRIFAIDEQSRGPYAMTYRNEMMAQEIAKAFSNGYCHQAVGVNGAAHLYQKDTQISLPQLLKQREIKTQSVLIVNGNSSETYLFNHRDTNFFWSSCSWNPPRVYRDYGFVPPISSVSLTPRGGLWSVFSAVLVVAPCESRNWDMDYGFNYDFSKQGKCPF